jgi:hypothetical protein
MLEKYAQVGRNIDKYLKHTKRYTSTPLGRRLHAMAMSHAPKVGVETMEKVLALSAAAFAANMGVACADVLAVAKVSPSSTTLKQLMVELATECVLLTSKKIQDKTLGLICDKGKDDKNGASFVKLMTYYDEDEDKVQVVCFGIEHAGNNSDDAANAIHHALTLFEYAYPRTLVFKASTTDAGGGGVKLPLVNALSALGRVDNGLDYTSATCSLHAMNLMISVPCETLLGTGGLKKRTFLQVLHTEYTLKGLFPITV